MRCFTMRSTVLDDVAAAIAAGLDRLAGRAMDVVLMDLQYTTAIVGPDKIKAAEEMVSRISAAGGEAQTSMCFAASP